MTPSDLKHYLQQHKQASLANLSIHFNSDPEAVKAAMETWVRKGRVRQSTEPGCSKGCCQCDAASTHIYYWNEEPVPPTAQQSAHF